MSAKQYKATDCRKVYRVRDGKQVNVPKSWMSSGSPYAEAYTTTNPATVTVKSDSDAGKGGSSSS